ncbi:hypothetical protein ACHAWF_003512 [Thalassiosira exigua]
MSLRFRLTPSGVKVLCLLLTFAGGMQLGTWLSLSFSSPRGQTFTGLRSEQNNGTGWRTIHVFAGEIDAIDKTDDKWYGQFKQDVVVSSLLNNKRDGYFIDLASNHPTFLSSTYALERKFNWTGLCIEPNTDHWWGLSQKRKCQHVGAVIGQKTMDIVNFRVKNIDGVGGHGGIIRKGMKNEGAPDSESKSFVTVSAIDVFHRMNVPRHIDYFSLDVEGAEEFIMRAFPLEDYHISLLSIEGSSPSLGEFLVSNGFKMVARLGEDSLWAHESIKDELNPVQLTKYAATLQSNDPRLSE